MRRESPPIISPLWRGRSRRPPWLSPNAASIQPDRVSDADPDGGVLVYVEVDDLGSYLDRAANGGATIAMPVTNVAGTTLTVAWIRDPQGNLLGLVNQRA